MRKPLKLLGSTQTWSFQEAYEKPFQVFYVLEQVVAKQKNPVQSGMHWSYFSVSRW